MDRATARFVERAKARREELGLSQEQVAQRAHGWASGAALICQIEKGKFQRLSLDRAVKIAAALGTTVDELTKESDQ